MSNPSLVTDEEALQAQYAWFLGHVASLALEPTACCESQGSYNVAHELWYFIRADEFANKSEVLAAAEWAAVEDLCRNVAAIPEGARRWTTIASESIENMSHPAWCPARSKAQHLLELLNGKLD